MSDFIKITVIVTLLFSIFLGRDHNIHSRSNGVRNDFWSIIAPIRKQAFSVYSLDKVYSLLAISSGAFCNNDSDRHTRRIHGKVKFGVKPPFVRLMS